MFNIAKLLEENEFVEQTFKLMRESVKTFDKYSDHPAKFGSKKDIIKDMFYRIDLLNDIERDLRETYIRIVSQITKYGMVITMLEGETQVIMENEDESETKLN